MKVRFILFIFFIGFSCSNSAGENENSNVDNSQRKIKEDSSNSKKVEPVNINNQGEPKIEFVENFYKEYITGLSEMPMNFDRVDSIKRSFLTEELYEKLEEQQLDFDPFLNAQDFDDNILEKIAYNEHPEKIDVVKVSYIDGYTSSTISIFLEVVELANGYRISSILEN